MIEFQNVTKLYKTVIGVNDVSLDLKPGAYGLLGPNGSGKTTFINLITGQLKPTLGEIRILGINPFEERGPLKRLKSFFRPTTEHSKNSISGNGRQFDSISLLLSKIGLCPSVDVLLPTVSGFEWVEYLMILQGYTRQEAREKAETALEIVKMTESMHRPIGSYSLGMRQRCKLAQAIAHEPELLILDEPFNGLDPLGRHEMTQVLLDWVGKGKSFLLASHLLHEVEALDPSLLLISGGRLLASGTAQEVRKLLVDLPNLFHIRTESPEVLAPILCAVDAVDSVRIDRAKSEVEVATRSPLILSERIPAILEEHQITVSEVRSNDGSLQQLFSSLMMIHRGQL